MIAAPTNDAPARARRHRSLVVPREHGAWGILLLPLLSGAAVGLSRTWRPAPALLLIVTVVALFWLRTPVESLAGWGVMRAVDSNEPRYAWLWALPLALLSILTITALLWRGQNLLLVPLAAVAGASFLTQFALRRRGKKLRMISQLIGAFGLTSTAAAACYVVAGQIDRRALALWLANWLFTAVQIQSVQLRIHAARLTTGVERLTAGRGLLIGELLLVALLAVALTTDSVPKLVAVAFVPLLVRSLAWFFRPPAPLQLRRLGYTEMGHAVVFALLVSLGFIG